MKATKLFSILATFFLSISFFSVDLAAQWTPDADDPTIPVLSTIDKVNITHDNTSSSALLISTKRYGIAIDNFSPNTTGYFTRFRNKNANNQYQTIFEINRTGDIDMTGNIDTEGFVTASQMRIGEMPDDIDNISGYGLFVKDGIMSEHVKCALVGNWPDYAFEEDYELNSLKEVEDFILANKHLPNVPSAKTVESNGIDVATMDATLLRQIEELWLHTIELNKEKEALETENDDLEAKYNALLQRVEALETK